MLQTKNQTVYVEIFDGLRSYYASYQNRRAAAGFHAAMTMSSIFSINVVSLIVMGDCFLYGSQRFLTTFFGNKLLLLLIGAGIAYSHVTFGKRTGVYSSVEPVESSRWKRYLLVYASCTAVLFICAIFVLLFM